VHDLHQGSAFIGEWLQEEIMRMVRTPKAKKLADTPAARRTPKSKKTAGGRDTALQRRQKTRVKVRQSRLARKQSRA
jgi:hypothetical protein